MKASWLAALRIYIATTVVSHAIWEIVHLPLYTIWSTGTPREIMFAVVHCTVGDFMIATLSLVAALLLLGGNAWPNARFIPVMVATLILSLSYTIYSEWANTVLHQTWAYSNLMPKLPPFGTGLSPLLQWIVVPSLSFAAISYFLRISTSSPRYRQHGTFIAVTRLNDQTRRIDNFKGDQP